MGLRLPLGLDLCLVHGADRGLFSHLERGLNIRLGRLLATGVELSTTEELERFDDNVRGVAFLAILVIPGAVGEGAFDEEWHSLVDTEGFDYICRFAPCDDSVPVCLFFLFAIRVSVPS